MQEVGEVVNALLLLVRPGPESRENLVVGRDQFELIERLVVGVVGLESGKADGLATEILLGIAEGHRGQASPGMLGRRIICEVGEVPVGFA